jgi:menaquinone-9 beta-reductase
MVEVHLYDRGQTVITPVASDKICVSLLAHDIRTRAADLFDLYPELKLRLAGGQASSPTRGSICSANKMRHVVRDRVALIGDAAGAMNAITGEGLSLGFRQAVALADALATDRLQQYQAAHRRLKRSPNLISALMLCISSRTRLRRRVTQALAERPSLMNFALAANTGVRRLRPFRSCQPLVSFPTSSTAAHPGTRLNCNAPTAT